jgi:glycosyltransferase involved in cell wall biosynthesis
MRLLFLAPQPFFQERGTPIAVRLALQVIADKLKALTNEDRPGASKIDLLTYHEGEHIEIPGVNLHRITVPQFFKRYLCKVGPGVSLKKIICDLFFLFSTFKLVWRNRKSQYEIIHAVEESVFIALLVKAFFKIPYIYDMDSSLAMQVTEKWRWLAPFGFILRWFERLAVRGSTAVAPVCDALNVIARNHGAKESVILRDISLLEPVESKQKISLREELLLSSEAILVVYIGNLEHYQGIDLLLESFAAVENAKTNARIAIIGGSNEHINFYKEKSKKLQIDSLVHFLGPRPVTELGFYVNQADILVSPRIKGNNTPMKIYSYLHSGKAVLATRLPTHTQVLNDAVAMLANPSVSDFSRALLELVNNKNKREELGSQGMELAERCYTFNSFSKELCRLYDSVGNRLYSKAA